MAKLFIDANLLFDISERNPAQRNVLSGHSVYVSPLSYHILFYIYKYKVPNQAIIEHKNELQIVDLTEKILTNALRGPTPDLEDNIQLHSAAESECDCFLTNDKDLLKMTYFGKTRIVDHL